MASVEGRSRGVGIFLAQGGVAVGGDRALARRVRGPLDILLANNVAVVELRAFTKGRLERVSVGCSLESVGKMVAYRQGVGVSTLLAQDGEAIPGLHVGAVRHWRNIGALVAKVVTAVELDTLLLK